jgi:pSer/pThr/pTyr-binding forkhead associated (FHA) protein
MKTYIVGRSKKSDIYIKNADLTVSGLHLEIIEDTDGKYYVIDRNSSNGTYYQQTKQRIQQSYVDFDEALFLGNYKTTLRQLLNMRNQTASSTDTTYKTHLNDKVERNPETGEIISRR